MRPETHRLTIQAEAYLATMPKKRKNSAKQAEAFANNMKNRHVVKAAPVVAEVEQQPTKKKRGPQLGSTYRTEVNQLGLGAGHCGTTALSKRCTSIDSFKTLPLQGRQSQAGKKGGSYKQIQSSQQQQLATRLQAIASQLSTADAEFVGAAFTCIGTQGGDVVKHLMGELAAANTRADKAEAEAVDFQLRSASSKPRNGITGNAGVFIHFALSLSVSPTTHRTPAHQLLFCCSACLLQIYRRR